LAALRTPLTRGEWVTFKALDAGLPADWEIYVQPHLNGCRPDFVLLNPKVGIGVIEVKDWTLDPTSTRWVKNRFGADILVRHGGSRRDLDPVRQLHHYKREIFDVYCPGLDARYGLAVVGAGLFLPFADERQAQTLFGSRMSTAYDYVVGRQSFDARDIARIFPPACSAGSRFMSAEAADDLRSWLIEPDHAAERRERLPLDSNQRDLASTRTISGYRRIRGPAGSGKSAVLAARAARLSKEGKRTLVVSYNITLLHYLRDLCSRAGIGRRNDVTWINFHALCKRLALALGLESAYDAKWKDHFELGFDAFVDIPKMLFDAISAGDTPLRLYDAVLVDEGQDFDPSWWQLLRRLCRPDGEMVIVADTTQDVYDKARLWTDQAMIGAGFSGRWNELPSSYRMPSPLLHLAARFAESFLPVDQLIAPAPPQGELATEPCHLRWVQVASEAVAQACVDEALRFVTVRTIATVAVTDLTVLVDRIDVGVDIVKILNVRGIRTAETFVLPSDADKTARREERRKKLAFWKGSPRVKVTTLHSYKGWEGRTLVVGLTRARTPTDRALIYSGLTRLKRHPAGSFLTVVCCADGLREFGALWPDFSDRNGQPAPMS
jgi:thymidine kinase